MTTGCGAVERRLSQRSGAGKLGTVLDQHNQQLRVSCKHDVEQFHVIWAEEPAVGAMGKMENIWVAAG